MQYLVYNMSKKKRKKLKKIVMGIILIVCITGFILYIIINNGVKKNTGSNTHQIMVSETLAKTATPLNVTKTPIITSTPEPTITATSTSIPDYSQIEFLNFDAVYKTSSRFELEMNELSGNYYASGRINDGVLIAYKCEFRTDKPSHLVCSSGPLPFDTKVNLQLYSELTDELVFSWQIKYDFYSHGEVIPSPTGVICEVEPQWNGKIPAHQLGVGCFAMSCWQNGEYLWGTDNTCQEPWPFKWNFVHPLNPTP
jgi:hypothetical protein